MKMYTTSTMNVNTIKTQVQLSRVPRSQVNRFDLRLCLSTLAFDNVLLESTKLLTLDGSHADGRSKCFVLNILTILVFLFEFRCYLGGGGLHLENPKHSILFSKQICVIINNLDIFPKLFF